MSSQLPRDADWVRQSFLLANKRGEALLEDLDREARFFTTAALKYTDTTPGGNFAINPPPQFTRYADLKLGGRFSGSKGMGRYYSEAIDDNSQLINMRFGLPRFNSLTQFFTGFYNTGAGQLARTGRSKAGFYAIGKAAGLVVSVLAWPILAIHVLGVAYKFAFDRQPSKFYYLEPKMALYWNAVQSMANHLAVNRGIIQRVMSNEQQRLFGMEENNTFANTELHRILPEIFHEDGGIDVYALSRRAHRMHKKQSDLFQKIMEENEGVDPKEALKQLLSMQVTDHKPSFKNYLQKWVSLNMAQAKVDTKSGQVESTTEAIEYEKGETQGTFRQVGSWIQEKLALLALEADDASQFITLRVNYTGPVTESFSNSTGQSEIAQKINSISSSARATRFNFAEGNVSDGFVGKAMGAVASAATDFLSGLGQSLEISGLAALGGSAFVDIPEYWQQSVASLPSASYSVHLVSPYGNPISQFLNLDLPLCMLLAGALPLSTGKQSYTSPFLVELYDQGRRQIRLGIIDSLSITRGTTNLGFNNAGNAMAIEVTFTVKDLSSVMHMPINEGFSLNPLDGVFDEDTNYTDYLATLASMNMNDQIYQGRKLKLNLARKIANWKSIFSWEHHATWIGGARLFPFDIKPVRLISVFFPGTPR